MTLWYTKEVSGRVSIAARRVKEQMMVTTMIPCEKPDSGAGATPSATESTDRARAELSAMQAIADLLARLPDDAARARVLSWAEGIFRPTQVVSVVVPRVSPPTAATSQAPIQAAPPAVAADEDGDLSVGGIEDWFENTSTSDPAAERSQADADQPVVAMKIVRPPTLVVR